LKAQTEKWIMGKNFFIVLSISAFSARAGNPPSMINKAEEGV